jgi:D-serine deaminase-like pyridoxal phosphate-dependent protein
MHQTLEIARLQIGDDPEEARVLVTNLSDAENLLPLFLEYQKEGKQVNVNSHYNDRTVRNFADGSNPQVIYGVPVPPSQVERIANLARILGRGGGIVRLLVQHTSQIQLLQQISRLAGYPVYVYIHVGVDDEACGVRPGSQEFQDLFAMIEQIVLREGPISFIGPGFYSHLDHGEFVLDPNELLRPLNTQLSGLLGASPVQNIRLSINATATISHLPELLINDPKEERRVAVEALRETLHAISQADSFIEVHDGAYPLIDLNFLARKDVLGLGKVTSQKLEGALTILTEVCCIYSKSEEGGQVVEDDNRGEALIGLGSSILGHEPSKLYGGYGLVSHWNLAPEYLTFLNEFSSFHVSRVTPECGVLHWDGPPELKPPLEAGYRLRVCPNDATKASESFGWYFVINSTIVGREDEIVDIFVRWRP